MKLKASTFLFVILLISFSMGKQDVIDKIFAKYRNAKLVEMKVEKRIQSEWKTKDQIFEGNVYYSKSKFRWENNIPEKNWTIYNGKTLWNIQFSSPDFSGKNKVTKSKITKKNRGQILLMSLIDVQSLSEKFRVSKNKIGDTLVLDLDPLEKDPSVQSLKLTLDIKNEVIVDLSFQDDIGNKTHVLFHEIKFLNRKDEKKFEYTPTKDDEVTHL